MNICLFAINNLLYLTNQMVYGLFQLFLTIFFFYKDNECLSIIQVMTTKFVLGYVRLTTLDDSLSFLN